MGALYKFLIIIIIIIIIIISKFSLLHFFFPIRTGSNPGSRVLTGSHCLFIIFMVIIIIKATLTFVFFIVF